MLEFTPLSPHIGALVSGLDLDRPISESDAATLRAAFYRHRVLLLRQGPISEEQHIRVMSALGKVQAEVPGSDSLSALVSSEDTGQYVGGTMPLLWHADGAFLPTGSLQAISLCALKMERSEPTVFSNQVRAAALLPPELKARIRNLEVMQCINLGAKADYLARTRLSEKAPEVPMEQFPCTVRRLLDRHPYTGEDVLYHDQFFTSHLMGMSDAESDALFDELMEYQYAPDNVYRHDYQVDDLIIWDNVGLQHSRPAIAEPRGRVLRRVAINPRSNRELMAGIKPAASRKIGADASW